MSVTKGLLAALCVVSVGRSADVLAESDAAPVSQEPALEEIVVTATRREESLQTVPLSITALSHNDLAAQGVIATPDLVEVTPSLSIQGSYTRQQPQFFLRGIGNTQNTPNGNAKVGVYIDDTYLNSQAAQGAGLFDIDRVEIARGPQGYLFGQNTTGGLIHVITNKPKIGAGFTADGDLTVGRFDELDPEVALGFDTSANSAVRVSVSDQNREGYSRNLLLNQRDGRINILAWRAQWLWKPLDEIEILANVHGSRDRSGIVPYKQVGLFDPATGLRCAAPGLGSGCVDPSGYADTANLYAGQWNVPNQHAWVDAQGTSLAVNWRLPAFTLTSVTAYERNTSRTHEDTDGGPADILRGDFYGNPRQISQEIRLASPEQRFRWLAGLYYFREDLDSSVAYLAPGLGPGGFTGSSNVLEGVGQVSSLATKSYAGFGNVDYAATDRLKLSLGLRVTHERKSLQYNAYIDDITNFGPADFVSGALIPANALAQTIAYPAERSWNPVSGRASVSYELIDGVFSYASFARGFNSGNYDGGAFTGTNPGGVPTQGDASLVNPETLRSYEVGIKSQIGPALRVNLGVYKYNFRDMQVFIIAASGANVFQQLANAAAASLHGGELELAWKPAAAWTLQLGSGYTESRFDSFHNSLSGDLTGKTLPSAPKFNVNGLARYEIALPKGTLGLEVNGKYQSSQFFSVNNDPLLKQGGYGTWDARVSYSILNDRLVVSFWGKNLSNRGYFVGAYDLSAYGWDQYNVGEPRTYGVTVHAAVR
jgi:iron complex outermembrane recepter protein